MAQFPTRRFYSQSTRRATRPTADGGDANDATPSPDFPYKRDLEFPRTKHTCCFHTPVGPSAGEIIQWTYPVKAPKS